MKNKVTPRLNPIDKNLEQYKGKILFPEKLKKANEILAKSDLPKLVE